MNTQDIIFFNKEGRALNFTYNENREIFEGKMMFDVNSDDTFKSQALYVFEKVKAVSMKEEFELSKFQLFNENGYRFNVGDNIERPITNIAVTNNLSTYKTKWVSGENFHIYYPIGTIVKFKGLTGEFEEISSQVVLTYTVLKTKRNSVLLQTNNTNSTFVAPVSYTGAKLVSLSSVQMVRNTSSWNETTPVVAIGKKISIIGTKTNDGVATVKELCATRNRKKVTLPTSSYTSPTTNSFLECVLEIKTDRLMVYSGTATFNYSTTNTITFDLGVPSFLKVGDEIVSKNGQTVNKQNAVITNIDKTTNIVTVTVVSNFTSENISTEIYITTNKLTLRQELLTYNNSINLNVTFGSFVSNYKSIFNLNNCELEYKNNSIVITNLLDTDYIDIIFSKIVSNVKTTLTSITTTQVVDYFSINEKVVNEANNVGNSENYRREIIFTNIDSTKLNIRINGKDYSVDTNGNISTSLGLWKTAYITNDSYLLNSGIICSVVNSVGGLSNPDRIIITSERPNVSIYTEIFVGDLTVYKCVYQNLLINNIYNKLSINIDGILYEQNYNTNITTTINSWITTHDFKLKQENLITERSGSNLVIYTTDIEYNPPITINNEVAELVGISNITQTTLRKFNAGYTLLNSSEVISTNTDFIRYGLSTGQSIILSNSIKLGQNTKYNILKVERNKLSLSYQGIFYAHELNREYVLDTDIFYRKPRRGYDGIDNKSSLIFDFQDTYNEDIFFYDFTGNQLKAQTNSKLTYTGIKPLYDVELNNDLFLNRLPNQQEENSTNPIHQQTIFNKLEYELDYVNSEDDINQEIEPIQVFCGFNSKEEGVSFSTIYVYIKDNENYLIPTETTLSTPNNLLIFNSANNTVTLQSASVGITFLNSKLKKGQYISFNGKDNSDKAIFQNNGKIFKILNITSTVLTLDNSISTMIDESNVYTIPVDAPPFYTNDILETQDIAIPITIKIEIQPIAEIQIYGQTEVEDERFSIHLSGIKSEILKIEDFYIFKNYDIGENGIDWTIINKKKKELIQIYDDIFDNIDNYTSVVNAINYFGYNELSFYEYFRNINITSPRFGSLFNSELINLFDNNVIGYSTNNRFATQLPNDNYIKTNLYGLSYKITDSEGNYLSDGITLEEAQNKLYKLKTWLQRHIMELGTKLIDIQGKISTVGNNYITSDNNYINKIYCADEITPVLFDVYTYINPIGNNSSNINIDIKCVQNDNIDQYEIKVITFSCDDWDYTKFYNIDEQIYYLGKIYTCIKAHINKEPDSKIDVNYWEVTTNYKLIPVQRYNIFKNDYTISTITINKLIDPHVYIEIISQNNYGSIITNNKYYSVNFGFWN